MKQKEINRGLRAVADIDPFVQAGLAVVGYPPPRIRPQGFETFFSTIVSQQISTAAASAIMSRVRELLPDLSPKAVRDLPSETLRTAGLSARKVEYAKGLAEAIVNGAFDAAVLESLDDTEAIDQIVSLRGFGRWSAEIYLMMSLHRRNIFPADDLALQVALQRLRGLSDKPTPAKARELTAHWAPHRSACSLFLWHYYRGAPV